jgi:chaperonin GroES
VKIKPIDDRVLAEVIKDDEERVGSIIIPDTAKEKPRMAKVVAVGTDEELQKVVKAGDRILYSKYSGDEIKMDNKEYLIIQRSDILAVVE